MGGYGRLWNTRITSPVRPVVFAHGWTGTTNSFSQIENRLKADGVPSAGHADLQEGIYPIPQTAGWLNDYIRNAVKEYGVNKINLFAHSKGGLVSRQSLYDVGIAGMVEHLVTFDSPHHGTVWADNQVLMADVCFYTKYPLDWTKAKLVLKRPKNSPPKPVRNTFNYSGCTYNIFTGWNNCQAKYVRQPSVDYRAFAAIGSPVVAPKSTAQYPLECRSGTDAILDLDKC